MKLAVLVGLVFVGTVTSLAGAATQIAPYTATRTTVCLASHHVIANAVPKSQLLPPGYPISSAIQFTFAMIPAQALDHGYVIFERDPVTAKRVEEAWIKYQVAQAMRVQGIDQQLAHSLILQGTSLRGNAITIWDTAMVKAASRRQIANCLR